MDQFFDEFPETSPDYPNSGFYVGVMTGKTKIFVLSAHEPR